MKFVVKVTVVIAVFLAAVLPAEVHAQGFAFPNYTWGPFTLQPSVSVGYAASTKPVSFTLDLAGFGLGFGYLFSINKDSSETYDLSSETSRSWNTRVQMAKFDMWATYDITPTVSTILGFRYDSFLVNFEDPAPTFSISSLTFSGEQTADFNFSGFFPIIGVAWQRVLGPSQGLRAGFSGFPAVIGAFSYRENLFKPANNKDNRGGLTASNEFKSGYFIEAFADFAVPLSSWARFGVFGRYNLIHGRTSMDVNAGTMLQEYDTKETQHYRIIPSTATFQRNVWFVGAAFSTTFWLW